MARHAREGHKAERKTRLIPATPAEDAPQSPLDFALALMRDDSKSDALRAAMAKAALPYLHKRGEEQDSTESEPKSEPKSEPMSNLEAARRIAHILVLGNKQEQREAAAAASAPSPLLPSESEAGGVLHAPTPPGHSFHSRPPSPKGEGKQESRLHNAPPSAHERAQRDDRPDPHPAYRWIP